MGSSTELALAAKVCALGCFTDLCSVAVLQPRQCYHVFLNLEHEAGFGLAGIGQKGGVGAVEKADERAAGKGRQH